RSRYRRVSRAGPPAARRDRRRDRSAVQSRSEYTDDHYHCRSSADPCDRRLRHEYEGSALHRKPGWIFMGAGAHARIGDCRLSPHEVDRRPQVLSDATRLRRVMSMHKALIGLGVILTLAGRSPALAGAKDESVADWFPLISPQF